MSLVTPFLSASTSDDKRCVLCNLVIASYDLIAKITSEGFTSLREKPENGQVLMQSVAPNHRIPNFKTF